MLLPKRNFWQLCLLVISSDLILLIPKLLFILIMLLLNILWKRKMLSLGLLGGFFCYKSLTFILLIGKGLRIPWLITCLDWKMCLMTHNLLMIVFLMSN